MGKSAWDEYVKPKAGTDAGADFRIEERPPVYGDSGKTLTPQQRQDEYNRFAPPAKTVDSSPVDSSPVGTSPDASAIGKMQGPLTPIGFSKSQDVVLNSTDNRLGFPTNYVNGVAVYDNDTLKDRASRVSNLGGTPSAGLVGGLGGFDDFKVPNIPTPPHSNRASEVLSKPVDMPDFATVSVSSDAHPGGWLAELAHNRAQMSNVKQYNKGVEAMRKYLTELQAKQADQDNSDRLFDFTQQSTDRQYGLGLTNAQSTRMHANASMLSAAAAAQARPEDKPLILGPGQTAFGLGGHPIASVPEKVNYGYLEALTRQLTDMTKRYAPEAEISEVKEAIREEKARVAGAQETPPVSGARKAPDGNWYVQQPDGKWGKVVR